jgi:hypothetical protein
MPAIVGQRPPAGPASATFPILVELEHVVDLLRQALGREGVSEAVAPSAPRGLFVSDAFTNPDYVRYALKGSLAVMICYTLQSAVDWPGIRPACHVHDRRPRQRRRDHQKTLRMTGAGDRRGDGVPPSCSSFPRWSRSPRSRCWSRRAGGRRMGRRRESAHRVRGRADRLRLCLRDPGMAPTRHFDTIRDRLIGILSATRSSRSSSPGSAAAGIRCDGRNLGSALRAMARLSTVGSRGEDPSGAARESLRLQASRDFRVRSRWRIRAHRLGDPSGDGLLHASACTRPPGAIGLPHAAGDRVRQLGTRAGLRMHRRQCAVDAPCRTA